MVYGFLPFQAKDEKQILEEGESKSKKKDEN
jgi:hypothetical protein